MAERDHIRSLSSKVKEEEKIRKSFFGENVLEVALRLILYFLLYMEKTEKMENVRQH